MNKEKKKNKNFFENVKTLFYAIIAALIIRSFFSNLLNLDFFVKTIIFII